MSKDDLSASTWVTVPMVQARSVERRRCELAVTKGPDAKKTFPMESEAVRVGTQSTCDVVLSDPTVSAVHCEVTLDEHGYRVRDLGSKNGVTVKGCRILDGYVEPGAQLHLGNTRLRLVATGESTSVPLSPGLRFGPLVGESLVMRELFARLDRIAATDLTVLITGETGSGKERVAQAIVEAGDRADRPFLVLDCAAVAPELVESELFGHERGAFSGAVATRRGIFELAHGGSLLLDEIGDMPLALQAKLLRVVETGQVRRVGGDRTRALDVRILAATHKELDVEVSRGTFREDLYHRLAVAHVRVPPLRDRTGDIPLLARTFCDELGLDPSLVDEHLAAWSAYTWPGNVRELRHAVERGAAVGAEAPPEEASSAPAEASSTPAEVDLAIPFKDARAAVVEAFERRYLSRLMAEHDGNISRAARAAGIDRMTLHRLLTRWHLHAA